MPTDPDFRLSELQAGVSWVTLLEVLEVLEVLEAQRTLNEVFVNYYDALGDYAQAVIDLSTVSGRWLLQFED